MPSPQIERTPNTRRTGNENSAKMDLPAGKEGRKAVGNVGKDTDTLPAEANSTRILENRFSDMTSAIRYEDGVIAWAAEQAGLLRKGRLDQLDREHLAEEIEDVGKSEQRELVGRMTRFWRTSSSGSSNRDAEAQVGKSPSATSVAVSPVA